MEITNNSQYYYIPLVVGRRIAQIVFFYVEGFGPDGLLSPEAKYTSPQHGSKYQTKDILPAKIVYDDSTVMNLMNLWDPSQMLPKLYKETKV